MPLTLLAVLAHPDDESFGLGGTLARYASEGIDVHVCHRNGRCLPGLWLKGTKHTLTNLVNVRVQEVTSAVEILGGHVAYVVLSGFWLYR